MLAFYDECQWCKNVEERVFQDSWTGMELCLQCLGRVADYVTNSPSSEGDNLPIELMTRAGDLRSWDEDEEDEEEEATASFFPDLWKGEP